MKSDKLIDSFLNSLYGDNKSKNTIKDYRVDLNAYVDYLKLQGVKIEEATIEHLDGYKAYLRDITYGKNNKHYSENTRVRRISSLKSFYSFLYRRKLVPENIAHDMTIPEKEDGLEPVFLTLEEAKRIIQATEGETHELRDRIILTMFLTTGMRLSELVNLDFDNIDGKIISIRQGKGNSSRKVNINNDLVELLNEYKENMKYKDGKAIFVSQQKKRMSTKAVQNLVDKYIEKAGLDTEIYSTHKLRHTAATLMLVQKVDISTIQKVLGHKNLSTTQIYAHVLEESMQEAADKMGEIFAI